MLSDDEKRYLRSIVEKELDVVRRHGVAGERDAAPGFLKGVHEYEHFLEKLLEKLR